jgi:hypothetical protein
MYAHLITNNTVTIIANGDIFSATSANPNFNGILDAIKAGEWEVAIDLLTPRRAIESYGEGNLIIEGGTIRIRNGGEVAHSMVPHILSMKAQGFPVQPLLNFLEKVLDNPSMRSRNQIWRFVSVNNITITPDGDLLFFKRVTDTHYDIHTGKTHQYKVGATVSMARHLVDDDPEVTCSHGLHVCSYQYLENFGGPRTMLCQVDPRDIVCVPVDYQNTKVRVCRLTVIDEVASPAPMDTGVYQRELDDTIPF